MYIDYILMNLVFFINCSAPSDGIFICCIKVMYLELHVA